MPASSSIELAIIVAMARNGVIGANGRMPWKIRDDLRLFKQTTMGHPVIMGRRTWDSLLAQPLPGRSNIIVGSTPIDGDEVRLFGRPEEALACGREIAHSNRQDRVFVIGGGQLYDWALPLADRLYISTIEADPEGDVIFPGIDFAEWEQEQPARRFEVGSGNEYAFSVGVWRRREEAFTQVA